MGKRIATKTVGTQRIRISKPKQVRSPGFGLREWKPSKHAKKWRQAVAEVWPEVVEIKIYPETQ